MHDLGAANDLLPGRDGARPGVSPDRHNRPAASSASTAAAPTTTASTATTSASAATTTTSATSTTASATTASTATTCASTTSTTSAAASSPGALPGAEGDRPPARRGQAAHPGQALLGRTHPARSLAASGSGHRPEPAGRRRQAPRLPGQSGRRAPLAPRTSVSSGRMGARKP